VLISEKKLKRTFYKFTGDLKLHGTTKKMKLKRRRRRKETKKLIFMINNFNFATPLN
jgi:polyisoprenoid-binding protein YceI